MSKPPLARPDALPTTNGGWYYKGGLDLLKEVVAHGARIPLAAVIAMETAMHEAAHQSHVSIIAWYAEPSWYHVSIAVLGTGRFSRKAMKMLRSAGGKVRRKLGSFVDFELD